MKPQVPEDAKVYVTHLRVAENVQGLVTTHEARSEGYKIVPKGGITVAQIEFANGNTVRASAACNPKDTYNKAVGRMIAVGRALKTAQRVGAA